jgi:esterase/lipase superfamily enzyme
MKYWMISNRNATNDGFGPNRSSLSYWTAEGSETESLTDIKKWEKVAPKAFKTNLITAADAFPSLPDPADNERQKHVTLFVHGYYNGWKDAVDRYQSISNKMFGEQGGLGHCVLFTWPSDDMLLGYYPDRMDARKSADDLAEVLCELYDWLLLKQKEAADDSANACRAKTSIIAHSMGNYVLQCAMQVCWTRKNQPLLVSLINQLLMVAADVDNDLFKSGETTDKSDGDAIANLTYRVTALYTGLDSTLGVSAGLKHFGKRRLGRSGLDSNCTPSDNVWDIDCTTFFKKGTPNIHSAYFDNDRTIDLMREILRGVDRTAVMSKFFTGT